MCYYGNVMTTTRWWLCVTILHLQQYSHRLNFFFHDSTVLMGLGFLIVEYSGSHSVSPHSVGLFWASEQLITEDATNAIKTNTRDEYPGPLWNSNPQAQQSSGRRPTIQTARPPGLTILCD